MTDSKELKVKDKQEISTPAEQTRPGLVFTPDVDIYETETGIVLLADMPGVEAGDLTIDLRDDVLTIAGDIAPVEEAEEEDVLIEYETGRFSRQFSLADVIDQEKIEATLRQGVLRLTLPKVDKATPRKITVTSG
jgi:HSP20 family molecular chaperone IbpA